MSSSMLSALCKNAWFGSTDQAVAAGISWQAHMDSCHMVGTGIIPSIKSKEIASFFKSTPLPHLYLFLSYSFFPAFAPLQTKLFPRPEITWSLCRSDSRVCEDEILWLFFFPPSASTSLNALVAQTGVVSHQLRHISVKQKRQFIGKMVILYKMVLEKDGNSFGIKMVPSILISLPCSPVVLIKAEKVKVWSILSMK